MTQHQDHTADTKGLSLRLEKIMEQLDGLSVGEANRMLDNVRLALQKNATIRMLPTEQLTYDQGIRPREGL